MNTTLALISEPDSRLNDALLGLTKSLDLPTVPFEQALRKQINISDYDFLLGWLHDEETDHPSRLALFSKTAGPVFVDFLSGKKNHRRQFGGGKGQPLARAVGIAGTDCPSILDATAGLGGDAFVFATLGCRVHMVERSPVVAALLSDALARGQAAEDSEVASILQHLSLVNADSATYLRESHPEVDVIYMDPMYPEKKKTAAAKKEMKALQHLIGPDMDSSELLQAALETAQLRVVVKRPAKAPPIALSSGIEPSTAIKSPNTRYDVYSIKALKSSGKLTP